MNQYDPSGSGVIKKSKYPQFLKDVFIKGSFGDVNHPFIFGDLLLKAATEFTDTKDKNEDGVTAQ
jgi:hypothetical protein